MCRLFFSFHTKNINNYIQLFLRQMDTTPIGSNNQDKGSNLYDGHPNDGYGFAVLDKNKKWILYKTSTSVVLSPDKQIDNAIFSKKYSVIFGHLRYNSPLLKTPNQVEDNHPFLFRNQVFLHNGHIQDFHHHYKQHKQIVESWIDPRLKQYIKGTTDSERIFFVYMTLLRNLSKTEDRKQVYMIKAVQLMMELCKKSNIKFVGNFMYADAEYAVIYRSGPYPLYYDDETDATNILVTRKNITPMAKNRMIPKNSVILINFADKKETLFRL